MQTNQPQSNTPQPRLIKIGAAAKYLGCSPWSLRNDVQRGAIPVLRGAGTYAPWRFDVRDLDAYIDQNKERL